MSQEDYEIGYGFGRTDGMREAQAWLEAIVAMGLYMRRHSRRCDARDSHGVRCERHEDHEGKCAAPDALARYDAAYPPRNA